MDNNKFPAELVRRFNEPAGVLYRAFDHLIGARPGMTLMVPVVASCGRLDGLIDQCPVPLLEATAILEADYAGALPVNPSARECYQKLAPALEQDSGWRYTVIHMSAGGTPCGVLIGAAGVRLAFTPDLVEGVK